MTQARYIEIKKWRHAKPITVCISNEIVDQLHCNWAEGNEVVDIRVPDMKEIMPILKEMFPEPKDYTQELMAETVAIMMADIYSEVYELIEEGESDPDLFEQHLQLIADTFYQMAIEYCDEDLFDKALSEWEKTKARSRREKHEQSV